MTGFFQHGEKYSKIMNMEKSIELFGMIKKVSLLLDTEHVYVH